MQKLLSGLFALHPINQSIGRIKLPSVDECWFAYPFRGFVPSTKQLCCSIFFFFQRSFHHFEMKWDVQEFSSPSTRLPAPLPRMRRFLKTKHFSSASHPQRRELPSYYSHSTHKSPALFTQARTGFQFLVSENPESAPCVIPLQPTEFKPGHN